MKKSVWAEAALGWVIISIGITGAFAGIYIAVQQNYRQAMNDPQIQIAEDGAAKLSGGAVPAELVDRNAPLVDIASSLDTWVAVFDQSGTALESSAKLGNEALQPPKGLFNPANWTREKTWSSPSGKETRVTWQPQPGVRQALVLVEAQNGYWVASGRSMRLTEERIVQLTINMVIGWAFTELCLLIGCLVYWKLSRAN